ncbi:hypothetical protein VDG1235_1212 [Verrucomicrobiia bacterium DG1235]|nr:hypothetical protein VDG1235_1212 [Verrucomicrobiae bacterium DG1235]
MASPTNNPEMNPFEFKADNFLSETMLCRTRLLLLCVNLPISSYR